MTTPGDADPLEPSPRSQAWSAVPQPQPYAAPPVVAPPARRRRLWPWALVLVALVVAAAGAWWWTQRDDPDPTADLHPGDCVVVGDDGERSTVTREECRNGGDSMYYVATEPTAACPDSQYASYRVQRDGVEQYLCLVPNLEQNKCYEVAPPGSAARIRTRELTCGSTARQTGAVTVRVLLRRDGAAADCPAGTTSQMEVALPHPLQYCFGRG